MFADLHLHTNFSDGTYTPEEVARRAGLLGLVAVALTDHDTVEGCARMAAACTRAGLEFIPATELTAESDGSELHLLGYFVDTQDPKLLTEMSKFQQVRQDRIREMVARLNKLHVPLQAEAVFAIANCRSPGRPHVGRALVMGGFCSSLDEAFERFLKKDRPAWVPKFKISALDAIALVHHAGGLAVMAHPGLNRTDQIIPDLVDSGLDGLECLQRLREKNVHAPAVILSADLDLESRRDEFAALGGTILFKLCELDEIKGAVEECVSSRRRKLGCSDARPERRNRHRCQRFSDARE